MRLNRLERKGFENDWTWLAEWFGGPDALDGLEVIVPADWHAELEFDGSPEAVRRAFDATCARMGVNPAEVDLLLYDEPREREVGGVWLEDDEEEPREPGQYLGRNAEGKFEVGIEHGQIGDFESLVATMAHGLAHVLLLGGGLIEENDEVLTDQVPVWFGFGIFGGNALLRFHQDEDGWHWSGGGSLTAEEYAYTLALREFIRGDEDPEWLEHLVPDLQGHYKDAERFLADNEDDVFQDLEVLEEEAEEGEASGEETEEDLEEARRRRYGDQEEGPYFEPDWSI
jgi:hypothetical protein